MPADELTTDRDAATARARLRLWLRLLGATGAIEGEVRRRLRREFATTLPRFDVLAALAREPEGLPMSGISRRLKVTNGNTTVLVAGLERDGLVRRTASTADRRRTIVALTDAGARSFAAMADAHAGWIDELLGDLDEDACAGLGGALQAIPAGAR